MHHLEPCGRPPQLAAALDLNRTTPPTSPVVDCTPAVRYSPRTGPSLTTPIRASGLCSRIPSSSTAASSTTRRLSIPGIQFLVEKIRAKLLSGRQLPDEGESQPSPTTETRYCINDKDVRSIIEFVLSQSREPSSRRSSRVSSFESRQCRLPSGDVVDIQSSPPSAPAPARGSERADVFRRLRAITMPILSPAGTTRPETAVITATSRMSHQRVMSPTVPEPIMEAVQTQPGEANQDTGTSRLSESDIWNLCLARPSTTTASCRTKPAPPTLRTSPVRAATTLQAVQDHAFSSSSRGERRRSIVSRSDLSVYSHGGESSTDGLTSFPKLRRRRSSQWRTPAEFMDRQNDRPDGDPL